MVKGFFAAIGLILILSGGGHAEDYNGYCWSLETATLGEKEYCLFKFTQYNGSAGGWKFYWEITGAAKEDYWVSLISTDIQRSGNNNFHVWFERTEPLTFHAETYYKLGNIQMSHL